MFEVIERIMIVPNLHLLTVHAPDIAEQIKPGQFVIVRSMEGGERIPLSVADWDREKGTLSIIFMVVGASTDLMSMLIPGDRIPTVVGPLGKPSELKKFGTVVCLGGCYGIGSLFPTIRELHNLGNRVITIVEGRSESLLYWDDKIQPYSSALIRVTRDGSVGQRGHVKSGLALMKEMKITPNRVFANGCTYLVYRAAKDFSQFDVPVIVSLNTIMIDGTGMCGVCRVTVDGKMKFACVDGPDFDGRLVDWDELLQRRKQYIDEEAFLVKNSGCRGV